MEEALEKGLAAFWREHRGGVEECCFVHHALPHSYYPNFNFKWRISMCQIELI